MTSCTIVAIAKNEEKYILEWIAHNFAIGVNNLIIFDNGSTDKTGEIIRGVSRNFSQVESFDWPSIDGVSPQRSAYNWVLSRVSTEWVGFIDIDEFVVPWKDLSITKYLDRAPSDVSSVHVNWRCFGSNGLKDENYNGVASTFTKASRRDWGNNCHYKTFSRVEKLEEVLIHYAHIKHGKRVLSDFSELDLFNDGLSGKVIHDGIQINHYQSKTYPEFARRMRGGDANYPDQHPQKTRDFSLERFNLIDVNHEDDFCISVFAEETEFHLKKLKAIIEKR